MLNQLVIAVMGFVAVTSARVADLGLWSELRLVANSRPLYWNVVRVDRASRVSAQWPPPPPPPPP
eukprot:COSAG01_NODE_8268_length_2849_cov_3.472364_2_plen_65_part_00